MGHCQRLLSECGGQLEHGGGFLNDVRIRCLEDGVEIATNTLILAAAAAPWLRNSLLDGYNAANDDGRVVVVVEAVKSGDLLQFFDALFYGRPEKHQELEKMREIFQLDINRENLKCMECGKVFKMRKLLSRHQRTVHSSNNPYTCALCARRCRGKAELEIHMRVHSKEKPFKCEICSKGFAQKSQMTDHLNKVHTGPLSNDSGNICEICGLVLATSGAVRRHTKIHAKPEVAESVSDSSEEETDEEDEKKFTCAFKSCGRSFRSLGSLKAHNLIHTGVKSFPCDSCDKSFTQKSHLTVHQRIHTGEKHHMCSICGKMFSVPSNLRKHMQVHTKDSLKKIKNKCQACDKTFDFSQDLTNHVKIQHPDLKPFGCSKCSENFLLKSQLKIHEKIHTGQPLFICKLCDQHCISKSALEKHQLIHTGERPHECEICSKRFVQKSHINYHMKTVHGPSGKLKVKTKGCPECGAKFASSSTLSKHMKTHLTVKPFQCNICGKGFVQKTHWKTHLLKHSGERPCLCGDCGKSFLTESMLKEHIKTHSGVKRHHECQYPGCTAKYVNLSDLKIHKRKHTGERPFTCAICEKTFVSKRLLADHSRTHTGVKPFQCKNCGKSFTAPSGLRQHFKRHDTCRLSSTPGTFSLATPPPPTPVDAMSIVSQINQIDDFGKETTVLLELNPVTTDLLTLADPMTFDLK